MKSHYRSPNSPRRRPACHIGLASDNFSGRRLSISLHFITRYKARRPSLVRVMISASGTSRISFIAAPSVCFYKTGIVADRLRQGFIIKWPYWYRSAYNNLDWGIGIILDRNACWRYLSSREYEQHRYKSLKHAREICWRILAARRAPARITMLFWGRAGHAFVYFSRFSSRLIHDFRP